MKIGFLDSTTPWEHEDPAIRRQAILERDIEPATLESIAATDVDPGVRLAAIDRIENRSFLLDLALASDGEQRERATCRWTALIPADEAEAAIDGLTSPAILSTVAQTASEVTLRLRATARLDDQSALMDVLANDNHSRVHQACAERVEDEGALEDIRRRFADRDKRVHQIARERLASIKADRTTAEKQRADAEETCLQLEHLAGNEHELAPARRLEVLEMRWRELEAQAPEATAAFRARADAAIATTRERIDAEKEDETAREQAATIVLNELRALHERLATSTEPLAGIETDLARLASLWPHGLAGDDERVSEYHRLDEAARKAKHAFDKVSGFDVDSADAAALSDFLASLHWPSGLHEPDALPKARARLETLQAADEKAKAEAEATLTRARNRLTELERKIEAGNIKGAGKGQATLAKTIDERGAALPTDIRDEFSRLTKRLHELRDWHAFVTAPKRAELCAQMEALRDNSDIHPPEKAKAIKALQDEWKSLGPSDDKESQQLWSRFKQAGDEAFAPCAAFFDEQKQTRQANLEARQAICQQLEAFNAEHDWTNPDYKALSTLIAESLKAWRNAGEVPHARFKKVSARFSDALTPLQDRLKAEQERNRLLKTALLERVTQLADNDTRPLPELIEETKRAQQEWKAIGVMERRADQKLWTAFRTQCDRVFARRDDERKAERVETGKAKDACGTLIDGLKKRASAGDITRGEIRQFQDEFDTAAKQIGKAAPWKPFRAAIKDAEKSIERRAIADRNREVDEIRRRATLCEQLEAGTISADEATAEWEGDVDIDADIDKRLRARRDSAATADPEAREANREAAALLLVRLEILAGIDSPPEAQPLRMQYQVDRLNRELSQGQKESRPPSEQLREIKVEWYCTGALPEDADDLRTRFENAVAAL